MEPGEARERLHRTRPIAERSRFCPDDEDLAAWYDAAVDAPTRDTLQRHFAECVYCQARLGLLARLESKLDSGRVPGALLAAAKQVGRRTPRRTPRFAPALAAAAMLVLAVTLVPLLGDRSGRSEMRSTPPNVAQDDSHRQRRSVAPTAAKPSVLWPTESSRLPPDAIVVRWSPVRDALFYDVTVMSDAGDLLVDERVTATEWNASQETLAPGADYFVRVEASLPDARRVTTDFVMFHVEGVD